MREPVTMIAVLPPSSAAAIPEELPGAVCASAGEASAPRATPLVSRMREKSRTFMDNPQSEMNRPPKGLSAHTIKQSGQRQS